jgi:2-methylcitrate dehydratase PrpD
VTATDDVVSFISTATPPDGVLAAAGAELADLHAALRRSGEADRNAHPGGAPSALNSAWRAAIAAPDVGRWPAINATVVALQINSVIDPHEAVTAAAIGSAVAERIAEALDGSAGAQRWSQSAVAGVLGAGAAAGRLLRLSEQQLRHLLGLCATQGAGLAALDGTPTGALQIAKAAANAVEAAVLARHGFTASADGLSGRRGLLAVLAAGATWPGPPDWAADRTGSAPSVH